MSALRQGDPDGMRALAGRWLGYAALLGGLGSEIGATMAQTGFQGPAATRVLDPSEMLRDEAVSIARALQALGEELLADAATVEALNAQALREATEAEASATAEPAPEASPAPETPPVPAAVPVEPSAAQGDT